MEYFSSKQFKLRLLIIIEEYSKSVRLPRKSRFTSVKCKHSAAFTKLESTRTNILVSPRFDRLIYYWRRESGRDLISRLSIIRKVARSHSIVLRDTVTSLPAGSVTRGIADVGGHRQKHGRPASPGSQVQRCPRRRRNADLR